MGYTLKKACAGAGSREGFNDSSGFDSGFLTAREGQGKREIDVLMSVATHAVFPDPNHGSFKTEFAFAATVSND